MIIILTNIIMMSIDEYRKMELTPEQEWDVNFNPKRCSIEAINSIIVSKRGKGPDKKQYRHDETDPGPYYDPQGIHLHIWKSKKFIKNFNGEQNPNVKHVQYSESRPGYYCSICHIRNKISKFNWTQSQDEYEDYPIILLGDTYNDVCEYINKQDIKDVKEDTKIYAKWNPFPKSTLTPYQKFKLKYPDYKNSNIFINQNSKFKECYAYIK